MYRIYIQITDLTGRGNELNEQVKWVARAACCLCFYLLKVGDDEAARIMCL